MMQVLDLFSGIGGFSLGLERTGGFKTVAFCEIEPYCRAVLKKHWPDVPCYDDVRTLTADALRRDGIAVDAICGGFPCQDISFAGKRAGLEGARSGLWEEYRRIISEVRPRFIVVENVPGLLSLGMGTVLGDLSTLGYNATWDCIPASAVGAPHRRDRVWIVAYANGQGEYDGTVNAEMVGTSQSVADASGVRRRQGSRKLGWLGASGCSSQNTGVMAHAQSNRRISRGKGDASQESRGRQSGGSGFGEDLANAASGRLQGSFERQPEPDDVDPSGWWELEPDVGRVAHGVSARVDRLRALGNAVVPQIPELIGRAILEAIP